ncbi:hypothetical protein R3P38DRAFT_2981906 [Favolaschia claudopus]|uniref:Uncharacterized protein n=1 Tax=Favolaschia claudopus TaxID=2862362 RepID=A0AAW0B168_9AGAR
MVGIVEKNIVDPELRAWAMPAFSTTTCTDTTIASVLFMSALQHHSGPVFEEVGGSCGIPRVTLDGEKADWEDILGRVEKLKEYGVVSSSTASIGAIFPSVRGAGGGGECRVLVEGGAF